MNSSHPWCFLTALPKSHTIAKWNWHCSKNLERFKARKQRMPLINYDYPIVTHKIFDTRWKRDNQHFAYSDPVNPAFTSNLNFVSLIPKSAIWSNLLSFLSLYILLIYPRNISFVTYRNHPKLLQGMFDKILMSFFAKELLQHNKIRNNNSTFNRRRKQTICTVWLLEIYVGIWRVLVHKCFHEAQFFVY